MAWWRLWGAKTLTYHCGWSQGKVGSRGKQKAELQLEEVVYRYQDKQSPHFIIYLSQTQEGISQRADEAVWCLEEPPTQRGCVREYLSWALIVSNYLKKFSLNCISILLRREPQLFSLFLKTGKKKLTGKSKKWLLLLTIKWHLNVKFQLFQRAIICHQLIISSSHLVCHHPLRCQESLF